MDTILEDTNDIKAHKGLLGNKDDRPSAAQLFNKYGIAVELTGLYNNASCFLVANGPSLNSINFDLLKQPGIMLMSLNNGPVTLLQKGIVPQFWTCVDSPDRFVMQIWNNPGILKFVPFAHIKAKLWDNETWSPAHKTVADCPSVLFYKRNEAFNSDSFFTEATFNWGRYNGARSVILPAFKLLYLLGFRTVYLLGVDLTMSSEYKYHFNEGRTVGAIKNNNNAYNTLIKEYFPALKQVADTLNYSIFNCNIKSKVTCFPYKPFEEAVADSVKQCGPVEVIKSKGMYLELNVKSKLSRQAAEAAVDKV